MLVVAGRINVVEGVHSVVGHAVQLQVLMVVLVEMIWIQGQEMELVIQRRMNEEMSSLSLYESRRN